jgi:hypothetical protein
MMRWRVDNRYHRNFVLEELRPVSACGLEGGFGLYAQGADGVRQGSPIMQS